MALSSYFYKPDYIDLVNWGSGNAIKLEFKMHEEVNPGALREAVKQTQKCYVSLQMRPVIQNDQLVYVYNEEKFLVKHQKVDDKVVLLDKDTHGYGWSVIYGRTHISIAAAQGMFDRDALMEIAKTLLYYYAMELHVPGNYSKGIYTLDNRNMNEQEMPVMKYSKEENASPLPQKMMQKAGKMDGRYLQSAGTWQHDQIVFPSDKMMLQVKEMDTTPFAFLSMILCRVYRQYMENGGHSRITFPVVANLRRVFGSNTMHNFEFIKLLQYDPEKLDKMDDETVCTIFRSMLDLAIDKDTLVHKLEQELSDYDELMKMRFSEQMQYMKLRSASIAPEIFPFSMVYTGRVELPDKLMALIDRIDICTNVQLYPSRFEVFDYGGQITMSIYHRFAGAEIINNIVAQLNRYGLNAHLQSKGTGHIVEVK